MVIADPTQQRCDDPEGRRPRLWLWLDPTSRCNLSCALCYTRESHGDQDLSPAALSRIIANLKGLEREVEVALVHLNWRGEPTLNPELPELIRLVIRAFPRVPLHWHTNACAVTEALAETLLGSTAPHKIYVSIDGGTERLHEGNRGHGSWVLALRGARHLLEVRRRLRASHEIGLYQLEMGLAHDSYDEDFLCIARACDEWVRVQPVLPRHGSDVVRLRSPGEHRLPPTSASWGPCFWAGNAMCVGPNGDVSVCLLSHSRTGIVGNLLTESSKAVWGRAREFRARLQSLRRGDVTHCRACQKPEGDAHSIHTAPPIVRLTHESPD